MSRPNRERAHNVPLARRVAGKSGTSPEGRGPFRAAWPGNGRQLNVPPSEITGIESGDDMIVVPQSPPPGAAPPQGSQAGLQAGAPQAGAPHAGAIGAAIIGAGPPRPQGERNSMKEGRRQLLLSPPQLVQPGAESRDPNRSIRQIPRDISASPPETGRWGP